MAPAAIAKIRQRHRGPMRLPKNRPPSTARARTSSGGGARVRALGPILDLQKFRFSVFQNFQFLMLCVGATPCGPFGWEINKRKKSLTCSAILLFFYEQNARRREEECKDRPARRSALRIRAGAQNG